MSLPWRVAIAAVCFIFSAAAFYSAYRTATKNRGDTHDYDDWDD